LWSRSLPTNGNVIYCVVDEIGHDFELEKRNDLEKDRKERETVVRLIINVLC
jgi:hypothetical protein